MAREAPVHINDIAFIPPIPPDETPPTDVNRTANMSFLGVVVPKKFPTPVLKPLAPFFAAGLVIAYGINSAQNAMMKGEEWKNDPRNKGAKH